MVTFTNETLNGKLHFLCSVSRAHHLDLLTNPFRKPRSVLTSQSVKSLESCFAVIFFLTVWFLFLLLTMLKNCRKTELLSKMQRRLTRMKSRFKKRARRRGRKKMTEAYLITFLYVWRTCKFIVLSNILAFQVLAVFPFLLHHVSLKQPPQQCSNEEKPLPYLFKKPLNIFECFLFLIYRSFCISMIIFKLI